jgi:hypothetical protein
MHSARRPLVLFGVALCLAACATASSPSTEPTPEPTMASASASTLVPALADQDPLDAGRYTVDAGPGFNVTVDVPSGWSANGGWVVIGPQGNDEPDGMAIRFYSGTLNLYNNPASTADGQLEPPVGPTVDDLVQAIVAHPAWTASEPTAVAIDGNSGQLVQVTIPSDAEFTADDQFMLFVDSDGGQVWGWAPGQTFDLYIVDVDGQRLVIDAFHFPGTAEDDLEAQREVVDSVEATSP